MCSGYVLAGGRSSRMGRDKARLPFRGGDLASGAAADWNLIVACDMPEVSAGFLTELLARAMRSPADVLLPYGPHGLPEPLCAVYRRRARAAMEEHFARGVRRVTEALAGLEAEPLVIAEVSHFQNVNTPEDWARYAAK